MLAGQQYTRKGGRRFPLNFEEESKGFYEDQIDINPAATAATAAAAAVRTCSKVS